MDTIYNNHFLEDGPLISVIIPVYNVQEYLRRCIDSIINQTYRNLEIIAVNDASTDQSREILSDYIKQEDRLHIVDHEKNKGLFQARLTGVSVAKGEYIAFVDSDDYISRDWLRSLLICAIANDCDLVLGDFCMDMGNDNFVTLTHDPISFKNWDLRGEQVLDEFMRQSGSMFSWHVAWNKLYKKTLWDIKYDDLWAYSKNHGHMLMWEDVAFSAAMWTTAQHVMNVHGPIYYYFKANTQSATNSSVHSTARNTKYINDVKGAMDFLKSQLLKASSGARQDNLIKYYEKWYQRAANTLYNDLGCEFSTKAEKAVRKCLNYTGKLNTDTDNNVLHHLSTPLSKAFNWLEYWIQAMQSSNISAVSFDVFDTLIDRLVLHPADLFHLLSNEINQKFNYQCIDFYNLRINAEAYTREKMRISHPSYEDITLQEIYETLKEESILPAEVIDWAMNRELELELEFCIAKESGKRIFQLAKQLGKKIYICSDMYLSEDNIKAILSKNGYVEYDEIFVSSTYRKTKASGTLYAQMLKKTNLRPETILHIGDNWQSDIESARKKGMQACHISKCEDYLFNRNPGVYTGDAMHRITAQNPMYIDMRFHQEYLGMECVMGLIAHHCFDKTYVNTNPESDYNADPDRIGYTAMGPHLLALCQWMEKIALKEDIRTIHFVARDGFVVKQAFDTYYTQKKIATNYIRLSRKALLLADVNKPEDLYSFYAKLNPYTLTAEKLLDYIKPIIPKEKENSCLEIMAFHGIVLDNPFNGITAFNKAIKIINEEIADFQLLEKYHKVLKAYFEKSIHPGDYIFDVGYSGRPESALSNLLGFPVGSFYIHTNNDYAYLRQQKAKCKSFCFYQHKPTITGLAREHLLMELGPSTIGYDVSDGNCKIIFEKYKEDYATELLTSSTQQAAVQFIRDFTQAFGKYMDMLYIRSDDASSWFENYLHCSKPFDRELLRCVDFEDDFGMGHKLSLVDMWNLEINNGCPQPSTFNNHVGITQKDIFGDGFVLKAVHAIDHYFPPESRRRKTAKKIAKLFLH